MTTLREDTAVAVSTDAAESLIQTYYTALTSAHKNIASFYIPPTSMPDGKQFPRIVHNGNLIQDGASFQNLIQDDIGPMDFDLQLFDCHMLNPNFVAEGARDDQPTTGKNMTILVVTNGSVKIGPVKESETRGFSESFVLVPNPEVSMKRRHVKPIKEWLIQCQNFRFTT